MSSGFGASYGFGYVALSGLAPNVNVVLGASVLAPNVNFGTSFCVSLGFSPKVNLGASLLSADAPNWNFTTGFSASLFGAGAAASFVASSDFGAVPPKANLGAAGAVLCVAGAVAVMPKLKVGFAASFSAGFAPKVKVAYLGCSGCVVEVEVTTTGFGWAAGFAAGCSWA